MDFDVEVVRLIPWMLGMARRYCVDSMDAEDLVGDTLMKMLLNRDKYDSDKPLKPWCEAIMQNTFITSYNRKQTVQFVRSDLSWCAVSDIHSSDAIYIRDIKEALDRCRQRSCCMDSVIKYAEGYSYDEIGSLLGIPVGTVRSRISSARSLLRKELDYKR